MMCLAVAGFGAAACSAFQPLPLALHEIFQRLKHRIVKFAAGDQLELLARDRAPSHDRKAEYSASGWALQIEGLWALTRLAATP